MRTWLNGQNILWLKQLLLPACQCGENFIANFSVDLQVKLSCEKAARVHKNVEILCSEGVGIASFPVDITHICGAFVAVTGTWKLIFKFGIHKHGLKENFVGAKAFWKGLFYKILFGQKIVCKIACDAEPVGSAIGNNTLFFKAVDLKSALKGRLILSINP